MKLIIPNALFYNILGNPFHNVTFLLKIALSLNIQFKTLQQKNQLLIIVTSSKSYQRDLQFAKGKFNTLMGPFK
jgi:hypothetical protein